MGYAAAISYIKPQVYSDLSKGAPSMDLESFKASIATDTPPTTSNALQALWYDAKGQWDTAHKLAQPNAVTRIADEIISVIEQS